MFLTKYYTKRIVIKITLIQKFKKLNNINNCKQLMAINYQIKTKKYNFLCLPLVGKKRLKQRCLIHTKICLKQYIYISFFLNSVLII